MRLALCLPTVQAIAGALRFNPRVSCGRRSAHVSAALLPRWISCNPAWACCTIRGPASLIKSSANPWPSCLVTTGVWYRVKLPPRIVGSRRGAFLDPRVAWLAFYSCLRLMVTRVLPGGKMARGPLVLAISTSKISICCPRTLIH